LADGGEAVVEGVTVESAPAGETFTTYNLAVAGFHTFFVGEHGVWVHNAGNRACDAIGSAYELAKKVAEPGDAIKSLGKKLSKYTDGDYIKGLLRGTLDQAEHARVAGQPSKAFSVKHFDEILNGHGRPKDGMYKTLKGKFINNQLEIHHGCEKRHLELIADRSFLDVDDVPGLPIDLKRHRGAGDSIKNVLTKRFAGKSNLTGNQAAEIIEQAYEEISNLNDFAEIKDDMKNFGKLVAAWIKNPNG
jgi:hypothetical protein